VGSAIGMARRGEGPALLELMTERLVGHYIGDAEQYRRPGEVEEARTREPLVRVRARLERAGAGPEEIEDVEKRVAQEVHAAAEAALDQPLADPASIGEHVYV